MFSFFKIAAARGRYRTCEGLEALLVVGEGEAVMVPEVVPDAIIAEEDLAQADLAPEIRYELSFTSEAILYKSPSKKTSWFWNIQFRVVLGVD